MPRSVLAIKLRGYRLGDLWQLNGRLIKSARTTPFWEYQISVPDSVTMIVDGKIEACLGCAYNGGGTTVELWSAPSRRLIESRPREYSRTVKKILTRFSKAGLIVTVHADPEDEGTLKWLRWLGLRDSGERREWGDLEIMVMRLNTVEVGGQGGD